MGVWGDGVSKTAIIAFLVFSVSFFVIFIWLAITSF
jgi:hypothetical protein